MAIKQETYSIELVDHMPARDDLVGLPAIKHKVEGIIDFEILLDFIYGFQSMASTLDMKVVMKRQIYLWCVQCRAYIGMKEIGLIIERHPPYDVKTSDDLGMMTIHVEHYDCKACGCTTSCTIEEKLYTVY